MIHDPITLQDLAKIRQNEMIQEAAMARQLRRDNPIANLTKKIVARISNVEQVTQPKAASNVKATV